MKPIPFCSHFLCLLFSSSFLSLFPHPLLIYFNTSSLISLHLSTHLPSPSYLLFSSFLTTSLPLSPGIWFQGQRSNPTQVPHTWRRSAVGWWGLENQHPQHLRKQRRWDGNGRLVRWKEGKTKRWCVRKEIDEKGNGLIREIRDGNWWNNRK